MIYSTTIYHDKALAGTTNFSEHSFEFAHAFKFRQVRYMNHAKRYFKMRITRPLYHYQSEEGSAGTHESGGFFDIGGIKKHLLRYLQQHPIGQKEIEKVCMIIESVGISLRMLMKVQQLSDVFDAMAVLCHGVTSRPFGMVVQEAFSSAMGKFFCQSGPSVEEFLRGIRAFVDGTNQAMESPMAKKIHKIMMHCLAFGIGEKYGLDMESMNIEKSKTLYYQSKYSSKRDFLWSIIDGVTFVLERSYTAYKLGCWSLLIHGEASYIEWLEEVYNLKKDALKLHNPEALDLNYFEYTRRLEEAVAKGNEILKIAQSKDKSSVQQILFELERLRIDEVTKTAMKSERKTPFGVLVAGPPGVAKSMLSKLLFYQYGRVRNLPLSSDYIYTRTIGEEFWSGFSTHQWCVRIDDIANQNPNFGLDPSIQELLYIINNVPYAPNQAELNLKGKTPLKSELVMCTTNKIDLNARIYYESELAVRRRFPFTVWVTIKKEFSKDGMGLIIDPAKIPTPEEGDYPDIWNFEIMEIRPAETNEGDRAHGTMHLVKRLSNIYELLYHFSEQVYEHNEQQDSVLMLDRQLLNVSVCAICSFPEKHCQCVRYETQSAEEIFIEITRWFLLWFFIVRPLQNWYGRQVAWYKRLWIPTDDLVDMQKELKINLSCSIQQGDEQGLRAKMRLMGRRAQEALYSDNHVKALFGFLGVLLTFVGIIGAKKIFAQQLGLDEQMDEIETPPDLPEDISSVARVPEGQDEKPNPWYVEHFVPSDIELNRHTRSWKALPIHEVRKKLENNVKYINARFLRDGVGMKRRFVATGIGGHLYVANDHSIPSDVDQLEFEVISSPIRGGVNANTTVEVHQCDLFRMPDKDLVFFELRVVPPCRNITGLVLNRPLTTTMCGGFIMVRKETGDFVPNAVKAVTWTQVQSPHQGSVNGYRGYSVDQSQKGDCGSPMLLAHPSGPIIAGIHTLGTVDTKEVVSFPFFSEDIAKAQKHFGSVFIEQSSPDFEDQYGNKMEIMPLHHKSIFRYLEEGSAEVYGSLPGFRARHKSKVTTSMIGEDMMAFGFHTKYTHPVMTGWEVWRNGAQPVVQQKFCVENNLLDKCCDAFVEDIVSELDSNYLGANLHFLDDVSVVNGRPGVKFIDAMNFSTSMGFPWRKKKDYFTDLVTPVEPYQVLRLFKPSIMARVKRVWDKYSHGERACPIFIGHLKDEPVTQKKVTQKKTRVFMGAPVDWVFVVRKVLLSFVRVFQNNPFLFEGAPGMNVHSPQWDALFHHLTAFGFDNTVAGDFSNFDKHMQPTFILSAFRFIAKIHEKAGWTESEVRMIYAIGEDIAFSYADYNGDLVQFFGSNPSGHSLTVIINSIVNCLYMRYAFVKITSLPPTMFKELVRLMTYGDDNIMGISPFISDTFNHTSISELLGSIDVTYTMADKEMDSVPLISIWDSSFLKRNWLYDYALQRIVAVLDEESVVRSLMLCIPSSEVCEEKRCADSAYAALREVWFMGPDKYQFYADLITYFSHKYQFGLYGLQVPTWEELYKEFDELCVCECIENYGLYASDICLLTMTEHLYGPSHRVMTYPVKPNGESTPQLLDEIRDQDQVSVGDVE